MANSISNAQDIIDSRDVIARIEELESEIEDVEEQMEDDTNEETIEALQIERDDFDEELKPLQELAKEASGYAADWIHGEALIRDSYFTEYAEQMAGDIGAIDPDANWPLDHIDWDAAAEALKVDYTSVDFDGTEYWIR